MSTNHVTGGTVRLNLAIHPICAFFKQYWRTFQEERRRRKLRNALYAFDDHDLKDIGISRGMIEHIGSNPTVDPRFVGRDHLEGG
ncbi:hypothetical protein C2U70_06310 [Bradyrhizobium guangdongense]|uniref:DUF1127 domain-containing protein n=1 Tax=Bradyrhizobium guangdongense TaxID=1325090 RepID=UPI00112E63A0|nr:DUF1127 domain-containing protein [Bradyrhizobium guangdongense]TPQ39939.1 hypothetical protein C2U70_06310 [Bradyrhizobium guangdongense]